MDGQYESTILRVGAALELHMRGSQMLQLNEDSGVFTRQPGSIIQI